MKDLNTAAKEKCALAFEIAIKNCIHRQKGAKKRSVSISERDSEELYRFYCKYVENDREKALTQIGYSSRRAASNSLTMSVITFALMLALVFTFIFKTLWAPITAVLLCAVIFYPLWRQRRMAQKIWAGRMALKSKTADALEKMCLVLAASPLRTVNWTVMGGLVAGLGVSLYELIKNFIA
ncbi:MAG: hypothetical protein II920_02175 [Clostridia bacterium]|nr:hypothetical protein [Clostridia bacterium]